MAAEKEEERIDAEEQEGGYEEQEQEEQQEYIPIKHEGGDIVDCTDDEKFLENTAKGDCLFDSIAQVYYPIDIRDTEKDFSIVLKTSAILRKGVSKIYVKADIDEEFRKEYSIPKEITGISKKPMSLLEYAKFIQTPRAWGSDTDLEILSRILSVPFKLIQHNPEDEEDKRSVRVIEKFGTNPSDEDYYTICNLDDRHFVLEKHNNPHVNNIEEIFINILGKKREKLIEKPIEKPILKGKSIKEAIAMKKLTASECKAGIQKGETYKTAIEKAKQCLVEFASDSLRLDNPEGLRIYSPKYAAILQNIQNAPGSSLVYSQFLDMEGIGIFRLVMDANGYAPIEIIMSSSGPRFSERTEASLKKGTLQPRYITFSGAEKEDVRRLALDVFNARFNELPESLSKVLLEAGFKDNDNKRGQICRCFCITSAGAEGLSLKNVRAVHIMEPYWNDVRLKQVKGRAIRIGSHLDLPKEDQNVSIYTYVTCFGKEAQMAKTGDWKITESIAIRDNVNRKTAIEFNLPIPELATTYVYTSDEYLNVISERKKLIINDLETLMKSSAIDCELNYAENKDGTFKCLSLKGKVGDFLYHPDLQTDIGESQSMFEITDKKEQKKLRFFTHKGTRYAVEQQGEKFLVYDADDLENVIGSMESKDGKPSLPITFI